MTGPGITKEFVELIETRLPAGRWIAKVVIALVVLAFVGGLLYAVLASAKTLLAYLPTSFPVNLETRDWVSLLIVVLLFAAFFFFTQRRLKKIENIKPVDREVRDVLADVSESQAQLQKDLENLNGRVKYVEKKVGDEMTDLFMEELMKRADDEYIHKSVFIEDTTEANIRVELGKKLLREAAAEARTAVEDKIYRARSSSSRKVRAEERRSKGVSVCLLPIVDA